MNRNRLSKDQINELPLRRYSGPIRVVRTRAECREMVRTLEAEDLLGFDTETRPAFRKGQSYLPSLIQFAGGEAVYVVQVGRTGLPKPVARLLALPHIVKAGVAVHDDIKGLQELRQFAAAGFVDIGAVAREHELGMHGLRGLAASVLEFRISKSAQRSNWARADLTQKQILYAATDAWVSRLLYLEFRKHGLVAK